MLFSTPALPLLFQGEEYGEEAPFDYFTSHGDPALVEAVRAGAARRSTCTCWRRGPTSIVWADPQAEETFRAMRSCAGQSIARAPHAEMLAFYRALIALRRRLPPLHNGRKDLTRVDVDEAGRWLTIERGDPGGAATFTAANYGDGRRDPAAGGAGPLGARARQRSPAWPRRASRAATRRHVGRRARRRSSRGRLTLASAAASGRVCCLVAVLADARARRRRRMLQVPQVT